MWSHIEQSEVEKSIENLENINFLETGGEKIALNAFLMNYVQETIDDDSKWKLMNTIAEFYGNRLMDMYKINSAVDYDLKKIFGGRKNQTTCEADPAKLSAWFSSSNDDIVLSKLKHAMRD